MLESLLAAQLAKCTLELLINSGGTMSQYEVVQSYFKTLTLLMAISIDTGLFEDEEIEVIASMLRAATFHHLLAFCDCF